MVVELLILLDTTIRTMVSIYAWQTWCGIEKQRSK